MTGDAAVASEVKLLSMLWMGAEVGWGAATPDDVADVEKVV